MDDNTMAVLIIGMGAVTGCFILWLAAKKPSPQPALQLRREVQLYAERMEAQLRKHDATRGTDGWKSEEIDYLLGRLDEEVAELRAAVAARKGVGEIRNEAADVGNMAMMVADATYHRIAEHARRHPRR